VPLEHHDNANVGTFNFAGSAAAIGRPIRGTSARPPVVLGRARMTGMATMASGSPTKGDAEHALEPVTNAEGSDHERERLT